MFDVSSTYVLLEHFSGDFKEGLLSPLHASGEEFIAKLETKSHQAVTHHLLVHGRKGAADMLLRLL